MNNTIDNLFNGKPIKTRFAPSPTGYLHIGGLRSALYSYLYAKKTNGKFVLRIEDTDQERYVEGSVELIYKTLRETGLYYDEGPDVGGDFGPYIQSERKPIYLEYAKKLIAKGGAYYCFCSRERLETLPTVNDARKYDKHCLSLPKEEIDRRLANGEPYVIRQNVPLTGTSSYVDMVYGLIEVDNKDMEDNILIKSDGMPTYNFANVVDDHLMEINCVMRGIEYLSSTPKYNLLYDSFGWERPMYIHMPPIMKDAQHKLSKRNGDASYWDLIDKGFVKQAVLNYIALLGWSPKSDKEKMSFEEMQELFSLEGISKSPAIFDIMKLRWLNFQYLKEMDMQQYIKTATPYILNSKCKDKYDIALLCKQVKERAETFADIPRWIDFLEEYGEFDNSLYTNIKLKTDEQIAKKVLPLALQKLTSLDDWTHDGIKDALAEVIASLGVKNGIVLWPTRVALSAKESTPGGPTELCELLGKVESLRRINFAIELLNK